MTRVLFIAIAGWLMMLGTSSFASWAPETESVESKTSTDEVIVRIFGRICEYHREDVEGAIRVFSTVRQVEFLNDHGTVLVGYRPAARRPSSLLTQCIAHSRQAGIARRGSIEANMR